MEEPALAGDGGSTLFGTESRLETLGRVLIVDDEPQVRGALARLFRSRGFTVEQAATAEEALALAPGQRFTGVITDLLMPGIGGLALLQRLSPLQPAVRFLVVTGNGPVDAQMLPRGHRVRVFPKPWDDDELVEAVLSGYSAGHSSLPPAIPPRPTTRVLLVEDEQADALLLKTALRLAKETQYEVTHVSSLAAAREQLVSREFDVACLDLTLPDASGVEAVLQLQAEAPDLCLVVISRLDDESVALSAVQAGAQDYLVKGRVGGTTIAKSLRYAQERKRAERRLTELAYYDQLTSLTNRTLFRQRVAQAVARSRVGGERFGVLLLDMDRFKSINDTLGHDAGDAFLSQVAQRLRGATRASDTVARLGGDEFAVLVEPLPPGGVSLLAQRVLTELRRPMNVHGSQLQPSASLGAALFPADGSDCDSLLAAADSAMYVDKNRISGAPGLRDVYVGVESLALEQEQHLRRALVANEFELHYQPQVNARGEWDGAEALLRWRRAGAETLPAAAFLPALVETGLIIEVGRWALSRACEQLRRWREAGDSVPSVSVNLSVQELTGSDLLSVVRSACRRCGLIPSDLRFEVNESVLLEAQDSALQQLRQLADQGYSVTLDNFGTGVGSVGCLQSFPFHCVKLAGSIVREIDQPGPQRDLVGGLVYLVRRLGLGVVAEGVETEGQRAALAAEECAFMQGHFFSSPRPPEQFVEQWRLHRAGSVSALTLTAGGDRSARRAV